MRPSPVWSLSCTCDPLRCLLWHWAGHPRMMNLVTGGGDVYTLRVYPCPCTQHISTPYNPEVEMDTPSHQQNRYQMFLTFWLFPLTNFFTRSSPAATISCCPAVPHTGVIDHVIIVILPGCAPVKAIRAVAILHGESPSFGLHRSLAFGPKQLLALFTALFCARVNLLDSCDPPP
jgi:hypothetical protein